jgi:hypothetical protein
MNEDQIRQMLSRANANGITMDEDQIRQMLSRASGASVTDAEWADLEELGHVDEARDCEDDGFVGAFHRLQTIRARFGSDHALTPRSEMAEEGGVIPDRTDLGPGRRFALSVLLALEAAQDTQVKWFRQTHLEGHLLAWGDIDAWIRARVQRPTIYLEVDLPPRANAGLPADGRPLIDPPGVLGEPVAGSPAASVRTLSYGRPGAKWADHVATTVGSVLDALRRICENLIGRYHWNDDQATVFVLTGMVPLVAKINHEVSSNFMYPALSRISLDIDPTCTPGEVADHYKQVREQLLPRRYRSLSSKHTELVVFVARRRAANTREPWAAVMGAWNREFGDRTEEKTGRSWAYAHKDIFQRDYGRAVRQILRPGAMDGLVLPPETPGRQLIGYRQSKTGSAS